MESNRVKLNPKQCLYCWLAIKHVGTVKAIPAADVYEGGAVQDYPHLLPRAAQ